MEPKELMLFCLNFSGMVSVNGGLLLKAYTIYQTCASVIFGISLFLYAYFEPKPVMAKLQTLHYLIALIQIFCKFLSIALNQWETVDIINTLETLSKDAALDPKNAVILKRANKMSTKIPKIFMYVFCGYYPLRIINLLIRYFIFRSPQKFLEASWIPSILASNYFTGLLYQVATSMCTGFTNASYSGLIIFLTIQLSGQIQVLRRMMEDGYPTKYCVIRHQKLMRLFFRINRLLAGIMFTEYILSSLYSCISSFLILKGLSSGGKGAANNAYVLILVLLRAFLICYCGNIILTQSLHTTYSYLTILLSFADHK